MRVCTEVADLPSDGSDVTAQLNALIASYPDGTSFAFPDERYRVDGTILIDQRNGLTLEGGTFYTDVNGPLNQQQGRSDRCTFDIRRSNDMTFRRVRVEGATPPNPQFPFISLYQVAYEAEHSFQIAGCERVLIEDCSSYKSWGDGINVRDGAGLGFPTIKSRDVLVVRADIQLNGRQGLTILGASNVTVQDCSILTPARSAIDLEPNTVNNPVDGVEITDCELYSAFFRCVAALGGGKVDNVAVRRCYLGAKGGSERITVGASDGTLRTGWTVEDCTDNPSNNSPRLSFKKVQNVTVQRNDFSMKGTYPSPQYAVRLTDCPEPLAVTDNILRGFTVVVDKRGTTGNVTESGNQLLPKV